MSIRADTTPAELIACNTPALSQMGQNANGGMIGAAIIKGFIMSLASFGGFDWKEEQIIECAAMAYSEYYWLTLAELKQFFLKVKTAEYESHKNISMMILMGFLKDYAELQLSNRYDHYSMKKDKLPYVANISKIIITNKVNGYRMARRLCKIVASMNDEAMERLKEVAETLSPTKKIKEPDADSLAATMKRLDEQIIELVEMQREFGNEPDERTLSAYNKAIAKRDTTPPMA